MTGGSARFRAALARHTERLGSLYRAIAEVSGARVIVDSSKHVSTALVLRRTAGVDLHVVHLVRDSRGVAHSWTKEVERPETRDGRDHAPLPPGLGRRLVGLVQRRLRRDRAGSACRPPSLRYEDLLADPRAHIAAHRPVGRCPGATATRWRS